LANDSASRSSALYRFGWLDDTGDVIRWSTDRPPAGQGYIRRDPVPIDIDNFGDALL